MSSQNKKVLKSASHVFVLSILLVGAVFFVIEKNKSSLHKVEAQTANSFFFLQSPVSIAPKGTLTLRANVGTNATNFIGASVKIDITKVQLDTSVPISFPVIVNKKLFLAKPQSDAALINCNPSSGNTACTNGVIKFALAKCPAAAVTTLTTNLEGCFGITNTAQTGTFDVASIPLVSVNDVMTTTSPVSFETTGNEFVKDATNPPTDLAFTSSPGSLDVPIRGDSLNGDKYVTAGDLIAWRTNYGANLTTGAISGDFNGDGYVTAGDLIPWRTNYGKGG